MAALDQILGYLDKDGVQEIILQGGTAISARIRDVVRPVTANALTQMQLEALLQAPELATAQASGTAQCLSIHGRNYAVTINRNGPVTLVRVGPWNDTVAAANQAAPVEPPRVEPQRIETTQDRSRSHQATGSVEHPGQAAAGNLAPGRTNRSGTYSFRNGDLKPGHTTDSNSPTTARSPIPVPPPQTAPLEPPRSPQDSPAASSQDNSQDGSQDTSQDTSRDASGSETTTRTAPSPTAARTTARTTPSAGGRPEPQPAPEPAPVSQPATTTAQHSAEAPNRSLLLRGPRPWKLNGNENDGSTQPSQALLELLIRARSEKASDVHIMSERPAHLRVAGALQPCGQQLTHAEVKDMLLPLLDERSTLQLEDKGYADVALQWPGAGRLRANINRQRTGLKGSFRLVAAEPPDLQALGLPAELARVANFHQGLAVVSGPSGHGKTTTLAALVRLIAQSKSDHIITVEDPVEVIQPQARAVVSQRQVGLNTRSFASALKGALREDPDVIVIGELRDAETVEMALSAAETGHLVIATMATPSGAKTIDRLIDMFPPEEKNQVRSTLAGALKIVVSQRLLPNTDGTRLVAAAELITGSTPLWNLIRDDKLVQLPSLLQRGRAFGMIRLEDSLQTLVQTRKISMETALSVASDKRVLQQAGRDAGQPSPASNLDKPGGARPGRSLFSGKRGGR